MNYSCISRLSWAVLLILAAWQDGFITENKQIALNVLEICKEEKRYGELFVPVAQATTRAAMLTGVSERSLKRFKTQSLAEKVQPRKERSDNIIDDDFDRCVIRRTINKMLVSRKTLPTVKRVPAEI